MAEIRAVDVVFADVEVFIVPSAPGAGVIFVDAVGGESPSVVFGTGWGKETRLYGAERIVDGEGAEMPAC